MAARVIAQLIVMGSQIVGKAFVAAYKQAAANAARGGGAGAASAKGSAEAATRRGGMTLDEACQILNIKKEAELADIVKSYEHLYKVNDASVKGSFYLQSKVVRAKERIELERGIKIAAEKPAQAEGEAAAKATEGASRPEPPQQQ
ncbi:protein transporter [Basidiobolus meristosporus CBS 931.73]|uniref:Mitochondrial import inner membrane translocase subunit TIM16 n=1 Tax=Basidiobolus meristosporus CBS 931.73 TaxID=1314790 RepID=A0A1Y1Y517_9FUNG|nr:protein transporter [Basidiobolus meristosporus CBS 931.73]|eukprot:ORX93039.1 protein transporter [Basidiobolus meristosporus CBS 931.73]